MYFLKNTNEWNIRGNIESVTRSGSEGLTEKKYTYSRKNELAGETDRGTEHSWTYDGHGNRNGGSLKYYGNSDLLKKDAKWYYNYDSNGNLTAKGTGASAQTEGGKFEGWKYSEGSGSVWQYEYDLRNRLVRVSYSAKGTKNLKEKAAYSYDYRNLVVKKKTPSVTEYREYTPDGRLIYTKAGESVRRYIYGEKQMIASEEGSDVFYHRTDHLGSVESITDGSGKSVWQCRYEAFGNDRNQSMLYRKIL